MITEELFNNGHRRWVYFGRDPERPDTLIDTNEFLIMDGTSALLPDPGGIEIFPEVVTHISAEVRLDDIECIFASHQDPDVISSLFLWASVCPDVRVVVPAPWALFVTHFGGAESVESIPDEGMTLPLGKSNDLQLIPAHYVHSSGMFTLYDPTAKILFSADIGAALLPPQEQSVFVEDFSRHIGYMEGFHQRWMPSNRAKNDWVERVSKLDIDFLCPQHGSLFQGEDVSRFLEWFGGLTVGVGV